MTNALGRGDVAGARNSFFQTLVLGFGASILLAVVGRWHQRHFGSTLQ